LTGTAKRPTEILNALLRDQPAATNPQLADLFVQRFPRIRSTAKRVIWRWSRSESIEGAVLQGGQLDALLGEMLRDAGYLDCAEADLR
jgi:hypothetical protein